MHTDSIWSRAQNTACQQLNGTKDLFFWGVSNIRTFTDTMNNEDLQQEDLVR